MTIFPSVQCRGQNRLGFSLPSAQQDNFSWAFTPSEAHQGLSFVWPSPLTLPAFISGPKSHRTVAPGHKGLTYTLVSQAISMLARPDPTLPWWTSTDACIPLPPPR